MAGKEGGLWKNVALFILIRPSIEMKICWDKVENYPSKKICPKNDEFLMGLNIDYSQLCTRLVA